MLIFLVFYFVEEILKIQKETIKGKIQWIRL